jgi:short-subunit dehydrogenase
MRTKIDKRRFGPWALITGASSGIGREFSRQVAASGINVALVARREALLQEVAADCSKIFGVDTRVVAADLSEDGYMRDLTAATADLDIGLVISNAGTANPGAFLDQDYDELIRLFHLNSQSHLAVAHHFGQRLMQRRRGGLLLCGAMGAQAGIPYMANESGAKSFVQSFGEALHAEWAPHGIYVSVLVVGPTLTAIIDKFGLDPATMPMKPMPVEHCVVEGLRALAKNQSAHLPGRTNRLMNALIPASMSRRMMGAMLGKPIANKQAALRRRAQET